VALQKEKPKDMAVEHMLSAAQGQASGAQDAHPSTSQADQSAESESTASDTLSIARWVNVVRDGGGQACRQDSLPES
jgi:hypothetical protein